MRKKWEKEEGERGRRKNKDKEEGERTRIKRKEKRKEKEEGERGRRKKKEKKESGYFFPTIISVLIGTQSQKNPKTNARYGKIL
jgi:hypothetical protein